MNSLEKILGDFKSIVRTLDTMFCTGYAGKNPSLVQHLLDKTQQEEDRKLTKAINKSQGVDFTADK